MTLNLKIFLISKFSPPYKIKPPGEVGGEGGRGPSPGSFINKLSLIKIIQYKKIFVNIPNIIFKNT